MIILMTAKSVPISSKSWVSNLTILASSFIFSSIHSFTSFPLLMI